MKRLVLRLLASFSLFLLMFNVFVPTVRAFTGLNEDFQSIYGDYPMYQDNQCDSTSNSPNAAANQSGSNIDLTYQDPSRANRTVGATAWLPSDTNPHPLVLFAPGRDQNSKADGFYKRYLQAITSQGFIVVGANFSDNHSDGAIPEDAQDIKFLIDQVQKEPKLQGKINASSGIGLVGHSDGGYVALLAGYGQGKQDKRLTAVVSADGALVNGVGLAAGPPLLLMHGTSDSIEPIASSQKAYDSVTASYSAFAKFNGADHSQYITGQPGNSSQYAKYYPSVDAITAAFLIRMLDKKGGDATDLNKIISNSYSQDVAFTEKGNNTPAGGSTNGAQTSTPSSAVLGDSTNTPTVSSTPTSGGSVTGLRDQIAQMLFPLVTSEQQATDAVTTYHVGGIFVNTGFLDGTKINAVKQKFSPSPFVGVDEEGGQVDRLGIISSSAKAMGGMSTDQVKKIASDAAGKMKASGISFDAAPVLDLDLGSPAISAPMRSFSTDPNVVSDKAGAFADGLKQGGITPTFKHFPGIGATTTNSDQAPGSTPPIDQLKARDLKPYEKLLANSSGVWVMISNYNVPGLGDGSQASINKATYDLLRNDYKFSGLVITDDLAAGALGGPGNLPNSVLKSIQAGTDIALFTGEDQLKAIIDKVEQAANADPALKARIEQSSAKIAASKTSTPTTSSQGSSCCGGGSVGATELIGSDNAQKVWNYLIGKGLTPQQTAGVMGNMEGESGINPRRVESTQTPSGDSDVPDSRGYGIVQFTPGTKIVPAAQAAGKSPGDLGFQLDYIWQEITTGGEKAAGDALKAANDVQSATDAFLRKYERPADPNGTEPRRIQFANDFLAQYGSGTPSGSNSSGDSSSASGSTGNGSCGSGNTTQGPTGGTFSWPEPVAHSTIFQCFTFHNGSGHPGLDISGGPDGIPIFAAADGTVVKVGDGGGYGPNFVIIKHANGYGTSYGHMNKALVQVGDQVKQGQQIGEQGNLGESQGSHLHFNVFPGDYSGGDGPNVDPLQNGLNIPAGIDNRPNCS